ncbi:MAG: YcgN family cysteine cluster protein [Proteobacteria bacterium]|nr:YcgN family cysteine cluster protein [Pseudomonadota bacterium]
MLDGNDPPFWRTKTLEEMSRDEWEALCDGCGRCCLVKLEDEDTAQIYLTRLACSMLDVRTCRCKDYPNRFQKMPDCLAIDIPRARELSWLPKSCAYRIVAEGGDLPWWHPLVSGTDETVHQAGISVRSFAMSERRVKQENYWKYIIPDLPDEAAEPPRPSRSGKGRKSGKSAK